MSELLPAPVSPNSTIVLCLSSLVKIEKKNGTSSEDYILGGFRCKVSNDFRCLRAIRCVPRPAFLNQVPVIVKNVVGTRMYNFIRQRNDDMSRNFLLFPWHIPRGDLRGESLG
jgi:hypothetical protein